MWLAGNPAAEAACPPPTRQGDRGMRTGPQRWVALVSWRCLWEITPLHRCARDGADGDGEEMRAGQEMVVRPPGPWDWPVPAAHRSPSSFRLATLTGRLEADQIEFRAPGHPAGLRFEVETWARPSSRFVEHPYPEKAGK